LLEVEDEKFFEGMEPLDIGELPKVRSTVVTYGYPAGGEQISYTRGVGVAGRNAGLRPPRGTGLPGGSEPMPPINPGKQRRSGHPG